ncbi:hypothetical protein [uncultured Desulfovibrio sp.]|uniref:hypothetical protein n=1 Tax=uncultured Desulfovibrio sp. TaxID=167968 RepID=UPI002620296F|nr:hypothetical protein [uncultured Desulfovibrio sp.]
MSVISQKIDKDTSFTAPSDCVVSLRGKVGGTSSGVYINNDISIISDFSGTFETKGIVLKKGDTIRVNGSSTILHVSGFTIDEG